MSLPLALDTSVLVRLLTNDDPEQAERAAHLNRWQLRLLCADHGDA